jgi:hypothetical protein
MIGVAFKAVVLGEGPLAPNAFIAVLLAAQRRLELEERGLRDLLGKHLVAQRPAVLLIAFPHDFDLLEPVEHPTPLCPDAAI